MNKGETPSAMYDKKGEEKTTREDILKVFEEFYKDLFQHNKPTTEMEELAERVTDKVFTEIMRREEKPIQRQPITKENIKHSIKKIKNKATMDCNGISNKILKSAGEDFVDS